MGGPFFTLATAQAHLREYVPASHRQAEAMLGVTVPLPEYEIAEGLDLVGPLCAAPGLPDPGER